MIRDRELWFPKARELPNLIRGMALVDPDVGHFRVSCKSPSQSQGCTVSIARSLDIKAASLFVKSCIIANCSMRGGKREGESKETGGGDVVLILLC